MVRLAMVDGSVCTALVWRLGQAWRCGAHARNTWTTWHIWLGAAALVLLLGMPLARAATEPAGALKGSIEIVVSDGEGGISGVLARLIQPGLQERLGVAVNVRTLPTVVPGAVHNYVRQQSRHRATFLMGTPSLMGVLDSNGKQPGELQDFVPVSHLVDYPFGIVVSKKVVIYEGAPEQLRLVAESDEETDASADMVAPLQVNSIDKVVSVGRIEQFMAWLGSEGGPEIGVAETRPLSSLIALKLGSISSNDVRLVKYSTSGHLAQGLRQGRVQAAIGLLPALSELLKVDGMNLLAVTSKRRLQMLPDVPTLYENGLGVGGVSWEVLYAPKNTPAATQKAVSDALQSLFQDRDFKTKLRARLFTPVGSNAETAAEMVDSFSAHWASVIRKTMAALAAPQVGASQARDR